MVAIPQNSPQFTGGGTVFGRNSAQWNQYFASKVDAEDGTADNLTLTGAPTVNGLVLTPVSGVTVPLNLSNGTLTLETDNSLSVDSNGALYVIATRSKNQNTNFAVNPLFGTYFIDTVTNTITATLDAAPLLNEVYVFKDSTGHAATHNITINGNGSTIDGAATATINANYGKLKIEFNGTQWSVV